MVAPLDNSGRRRVKTATAPLCRHCAVALLTLAEQKMGIHIRYVFEIDSRRAAANIPRPGYKGQKR